MRSHRLNLILIRSGARARCDEAKPSSLRLVPPATRRVELEQDYQKMREDLRGAPSFEHIIKALRDIEAAVNG